MHVRIFYTRGMECICAQTRPWFILSSERVFWRMESEPMLIPRKISPLPEALRRFKLKTLHHAGLQAQHTTNLVVSVTFPSQSWMLHTFSLHFVVLSAPPFKATDQPLLSAADSHQSALILWFDGQGIVYSYGFPVQPTMFCQ